MVISYKNQFLQLHYHQRAVIRPKNTVTVYNLFNGKIILSIRGFDLAFNTIKTRPKKMPVEKIFNNKTPQLVHPNSRIWASGGYTKNRRKLCIKNIKIGKTGAVFV